MAEGGKFVGNGAGRGDLTLNGEGAEDRQERFSKHFLANEREGSWFVTRGNEDGFREKTKDGSLESQLQMLPGHNDHSFLSRDNETNATKFRWMNLLPESSNAKVEGMHKDLLGCGCDNHGRKYARLVEQPWSGESERIGNLPNYLHSVERAEHAGVTRKASGPPIKDGAGFLVREYPPHVARETSRKRYEEGSRPKLHSNGSPQLLDRNMSRKHFEAGCHLGLCSNDRSYSLTPRSQPSDQHTPCRGNSMENLQYMGNEALDHAADLYGKGVNIHPARCDSYQQMSYSKGDAIVHSLSNEAVKYLRADLSPNVRTLDYCSHPESQRSANVYPSALSEHIYDQIRNVQGYDNQGDEFANNLLDHTLQNLSNIDNSQKHVTREDCLLQSFGHALQDEPEVNDCNMNWLVDDSKNVGVMLGSANTYFDYGTLANESLPPRTEANKSHESLLPGEVWAYEEDAHHMFYKAEESCFSESEGGVYTLDEHSQQRLKLGDVDFGDKYDRKLKRKHKFVGKMDRFRRKTSTFHDKSAWSYDDVQHIAEPENEQFPPIRSINQHRQFQTRKNVVPKTEPMQPFSGLSESLLSRLNKPHESGGGDVKKRLKHPQNVYYPSMPHPKSWRKSTKHFVKPPTRFINAEYSTQLHHNSRGTALKRKFKAAPHIVLVPTDKLDPQVSHTRANIETQQNPSTKTIGSAKEGCHSQETDPEHTKLKLKPAEKDLPEDSKEFKRQVDELFLKCLLHLSANPDRQKRFKGQGKDSRLKCIICSSSKEFMETKYIAMHAFTSLKIGLRAPHLGFHKALCVMVGWESAAAPNGRWVLRPLPDAKARALKEDIIIWPPVVIIHNFYGANQHLSEPAKISIGHLKNILKDKGFDVGKTKVCCGGAENSTIMVVKFSGTLSGLQEAERLHNIFTKEKHGRNELQQVNPPEMPVDNAENNLYGYLGIVKDLHKLDHDMKLHCHAKSKKEILAFVNSAA